MATLHTTASVCIVGVAEVAAELASKGIQVLPRNVPSQARRPSQLAQEGGLGKGLVNPLPATTPNNV